ncbi:MAG: pilus assembly PilX N-terminal domain-containing protein [Cocleimonas sp.]
MKSLNSINQQGATLVTSMMMLVVMTIVGVSAAKVSSIDVLVAGNEQQKMMLFQTTQSDLNDLSTPLKLFAPLVGEVGEDDSKAEFDSNGKYTVSTSTVKVAVITDLNTEYKCEGVNGKAVSIGPSTPPCRLYDFSVSTKKLNSGARESAHRGAGKEVPNDNTNNGI